MLEVVPKGWFSQVFTVLDNGMRLADIDLARFGEKGTFAFQGIRYTMYRERLASGLFMLETDEMVLARAEKPHAMRQLFVVEYDGVQYTLKHEGALGRKFLLHVGDQVVGSMEPKSTWSRTARADFPAELSVPVKLFMVWLVLILWKRAAGAAAAAGGASG